MSRIVKPLTDSQVKSLKSKGKDYQIPDGRGLFLRVRENGSKSFIFAYKRNNKLVRYTLGKYPDISLAKAREMAQECRSLLALNIDPITHNKAQAQKAEEEKPVTFQEMAEYWRDRRLRLGKLKPETTLEAFRRLERHLFPVIGGLDIKTLGMPELIAVLGERSSSIIQKLNTSIISIFQLAEDEFKIERNPFRKLNEEFYFTDSKNNPTIPPDKLPDVFKMLSSANIQRQTALLIEWQLLTILRSSEAVSVEWSDVDFEKHLLHVPAERMKGGKRDHDVPLSRQALRVLEEMRAYTGTRKHIFATYQAPYNRPMSNQAANCALKRNGFKDILTAHGLRSIASTYLHDLDRFSAEAVELCLSHENRSKVRAAYDKSKKLKSRFEIMQTWGDYVEQCKIKAIMA